MVGGTLIHLIPYLISLLISTGVGLYAWRRREVVGARAFAIISLVMAFWTLGYIFELLSTSLQAKVFWDNLQWIAFVIIPISLLAFTLQYTGRKLTHPTRIWGLILSIPLVFLLLVYTDNFHQLIRPSAWLMPGPGSVCFTPGRCG